MTEKEFIKLANKILYVKQSARTPFGGKKSELKGLKKLYKAINYTRCCTSKAEQLVCLCCSGSGLLPIKDIKVCSRCDGTGLEN